MEKRRRLLNSCVHAPEHSIEGGDTYILLTLACYCRRIAGLGEVSSLADGTQEEMY